MKKQAKRKQKEEKKQTLWEKLCGQMVKKIADDKRTRK
jgi:hypothetical protein